MRESEIESMSAGVMDSEDAYPTCHEQRFVSGKKSLSALVIVLSLIASRYPRL